MPPRKNSQKRSTNNTSFTQELTNIVKRMRRVEEYCNETEKETPTTFKDPHKYVENIKSRNGVAKEYSKADGFGVDALKMFINSTKNIRDKNVKKQRLLGLLSVSVDFSGHTSTRQCFPPKMFTQNKRKLHPFQEKLVDLALHHLENGNADENEIREIVKSREIFLEYLNGVRDLKPKFKTPMEPCKNINESNEAPPKKKQKSNHQINPFENQKRENEARLEVPIPPPISTSSIMPSTPIPTPVMIPSTPITIPTPISPTSVTIPPPISMIPTSRIPLPPTEDIPPVETFPASHQNVSSLSSIPCYSLFNHDEYSSNGNYHPNNYYNNYNNNFSNNNNNVRDYYFGSTNNDYYFNSRYNHSYNPSNNSDNFEFNLGFNKYFNNANNGNNIKNNNSNNIIKNNNNNIKNNNTIKNNINNINNINKINKINNNNNINNNNDNIIKNNISYNSLLKNIDDNTHSINNKDIISFESINNHINNKIETNDNNSNTKLNGTLYQKYKVFPMSEIDPTINDHDITICPLHMLQYDDADPFGN